MTTKRDTEAPAYSRRRDEDIAGSISCLPPGFDAAAYPWLGINCRLANDGRSIVGYDLPNIPFAVLLDELLEGPDEYGPAAVTIMHTPTDAVGAALDELRRRWTGFAGVYPELPQQLAPARIGELAVQWISHRVADRRRLLRHDSGAHPRDRRGDAGGVGVRSPAPGNG